MHKLVLNWLDYLKIKYTQNTILAYKKDILVFIDFYKYYTGDFFDPSQSIDITLLRSWIAYLKSNAGIINQSVCRSISSIKNFAQYIYDVHKIEWHDLKFLKTPKFTRKIVRDIEVDKLLNFLNSLPENDWVDLRNKALLFLLYGIGLRIAEALGIKRVDIFLGECLILGKGQVYKKYTLLEPVYQLLMRYIDRIPRVINKQDYIFRGVKMGVLQAPVFRKYVEKMRRKHGLPEYLTPHLFRHCFARHLLDNKTCLLTVSEALGHKSLNSTERYIHINKKRMMDAYNQYWNDEK